MSILPTHFDDGTKMSQSRRELMEASLIPVIIVLGLLIITFICVMLGIK